MDVIHAVGHYGMLLFCLNALLLKMTDHFYNYGDPLRRMSQSKLVIKGGLIFLRIGRTLLSQAYDM